MFMGACTAAAADQLEKFFTPLTASYPGLTQSLSQSLESVRLCVRYRDAQHASLQAYLKQL
jgi:hypothetical protein